MNIVVVNQPLNNRGDEAAHKSLMRTLSQNFPDDIINVIFQGKLQNSIDQIKLDMPNVTYINITKYLIRGTTRLENYAKKHCMTELAIISHFTIALIKIISLLKSADLVVSAPGGICMGEFKNWDHLYWLIIAKKLKKRIAYYSRSFGSFPANNHLEKYFNLLSFDLLHYFDFISIRDSETIKIADALKLKFIPSIDTAFLDTPIAEIPDNIKKYLNTPYIVFVPNSLTWHPAYRHVAQSNVDIYYSMILMIINKVYSNHTIIMLPQLYNDKDKSDKDYFLHLKEKSKFNNIVVLDDTINSDIQQSIIAESKFVIGSRYHSIVFAINNNKPVIALSYERKIKGLINILNMENALVNFDEIVLSQMSIEKFENIIEQKMINLQVNPESKKMANKIADNCMKMFIERYKKCKY
jgi:colanic acid/amylovoran biosynthesis protein